MVGESAGADCGAVRTVSDSYPLRFAALLRHYRLAAGLTQEELAQLARLSARAISALERGVNQRPHLETIRLLAEALGLNMEERATLVTARRRVLRHGACLPAPTLTARESLHASPLVNRIEEMLVIREHLHTGTPPVLLFAGEPGIGKSRLLREAARQGMDSGLTVLYGGCQRRGGQEPYSPLVTALARYAERMTPSELRAVCSGCDWLVRLLSELSEGDNALLPFPMPAPDRERRRLNQAAATFLHNVAGPEGTLLLLDDLQWAGSDALDLLVALSQLGSDVPLRIIGTYRHTEILPDDPLTVTLGELAERDLARRVVLRPLSRDAASTLLLSMLESEDEIQAEVLDLIVTRADGVPFFLVSSAQAILAGTLHDTVPWTIAEGVRHRVSALSVEAQEMLTIATVAGRVVSRALLLMMGTGSATEGTTALEELCRSGLLMEVGRDAYWFTHDVIREVVESDLGAARRALMHQRIAETREHPPNASPS